MLTTVRHINVIKNKNVNIENNTNGESGEPSTEPTEWGTTQNKSGHQKNPKQVAAGTRGDETRWNKQTAMQTAQTEQETEQDEPIKITKEPQEKETQTAPRPRLQVNVYKNYIPLCAALIGIVGIGMYMSRGKQQPEIKQVTQASMKKRDTVPFEMG